MLGKGIFTLSPGEYFPPNFKIDLTQLNSKRQMEQKLFWLFQYFGEKDTLERLTKIFKRKRKRCFIFLLAANLDIFSKYIASRGIQKDVLAKKIDDFGFRVLNGMRSFHICFCLLSTPENTLLSLIPTGRFQNTRSERTPFSAVGNKEGYILRW